MGLFDIIKFDDDNVFQTKCWNRTMKTYCIGDKVPSIFYGDDEFGSYCITTEYVLEGTGVKYKPPYTVIINNKLAYMVFEAPENLPIFDKCGRLVYLPSFYNVCNNTNIEFEDVELT